MEIFTMGVAAMLSAVPPKGDRVLESFKMFLILKSSENPYAAQLHDYFVSVLRGAEEILDDPSKLNTNTLPEAISLAVTLMKDPDLKAIFDSIGEGMEPSKGQAERALEKLDNMERAFAFGSKSTDFGETVYAVI
jgi:hypothetical protein